MVDVSEPIGVRTGRNEPQAVPTVPWRVFGPRRTEHVADFSDRQIAVLFVVLALITCIPIVLYPWPPLADYINHLSRMHIIATVDSDPDLSRFYEINWQIIPNLMMDLVVPPLERFINIYLAGQFFTIASFVLTMSGAMALNRRLFGHWSILPLIAFPLLYNNVFLVGTMNYIFGMGLALWALVAWVWLRERNVLLRLTVSSAFVLGLFFCHLFSVGLYGLGLLAFEVHRLLLIYGRAPRAVGGCRRYRSPWPIVDFVATGAVPASPAAADDEPHLGARLLHLGVRRQARWIGLCHRESILTLPPSCSPASSPSRRVGHAPSRVQFHTFGWVLLVISTITYVAIARHLRNLHGGSAVPTLVGLHADRLRASQLAS